MKRQLQKGFTLIELMIVVAIIGILAAIAIPQYQDYVTRARWSDAVTSVASLKTAIGECVQRNNGSLAVCQTANMLSSEVGYASLPTITKYASTTVTLGTSAIITITSGSSQLGNCTVSLTPTLGTGNISWAGGTAAGCTKAKTGF
jgi:type IV pilus assembly protein PilA